MSLSRLAEKLEWLDDRGSLCRIDAPVDPQKGTGTFCRTEEGELLAEHGKRSQSPFALLLSNLQGRRFPMVGRLMTDPERICRLAGLDSMATLAEAVEKKGTGSFCHVRSEVPNSLSGKRCLSPFSFIQQPACRQVVRLANDLDATVLPSLRVDPEEAVQKITAATLLTIDPEDEQKGTGTFCRTEEGELLIEHGKRSQSPFAQLAAGVDLVVESPTRLLPQWKVEDQLDAVRTRYTERKEPMPVAIFLGGDPLLRVVAEAPKPSPIDPVVIAASLGKRKIEVAPCRTLPELTVPADVDLVIEGYWMPADDVIDVRAVTHRINPIVPFALPEERKVVRRTLLQGLLPWWRAEVSGLSRLLIPDWAADGSVLVGSVEKAYAEEAPRIAETLAEHPAWHEMRLVILLDEAVDLSEAAAVLAGLVQHADFGRKTLVAVGK